MAKSDYGKPASEGWSRAYELAWLKAYGKLCPTCKGKGCLKCNKIGYVEKEK